MNIKRVIKWCVGITIVNAIVYMGVLISVDSIPGKVTHTMFLPTILAGWVGAFSVIYYVITTVYRKITGSKSLKKAARATADEIKDKPFFYAWLFSEMVWTLIIGGLLVMSAIFMYQSFALLPQIQ